MPDGAVLNLPTPRAFLPLLEDVRYKGAHGGRGSGKSHFFAESLVERFVYRPDTRAVCIREVQLSLRMSVKQLILDKIKLHNLERYFRLLEDRIESRKGSGLIIFQGMQNHTSDSIKSLEGFDIAWVEEAQSLSERSLGLLRPTIRKPKSQLWFSWNPQKPSDPVEKLLRGPERVPDSVVVEANYRQNPWFPEELRQEMLWDRKRDPDKYAHVWLGRYQQHSQARVFRNFKVERFETPPNARFRLGADWGFSVDPTVLVRCFTQGRKLYFDRERWAHNLEIDHVPAFWAGTDTQSPPRWHNPKPHLWKGIEGATKYPLTADSADPQNISFMRRHGFTNIVPSIKGPNSVQQGIEFLKGFDVVIHEDECPHVADEFATYSYRVDQRTGEVTSDLEDDKNHTIDSARYAMEAERRGGAQASFGRY